MRPCYDRSSMSTLWTTIVGSLQRLATARPEYILLALALYVGSLFLVGARWRGFFRSIGGDVGIWRATLATLGGIAVGNLFPSSRLGGEACRIALVRRAGSVSWRQATLAAAWDRLSAVPAIVVLAVIAVLSARKLESDWRVAALAGGAAVALAAGGLAIVRLRRSGSTLAGWRSRLALDQVNHRVFAQAVGMSALLWIQDVLRITCAARAFDVTLSPMKVATLSFVAIVGSLVPSPAGLGPIEGGLVAGLVAFGVDVPTAAAITAAERMISYGFSTSAGSLVVALQGGRTLWRSVRRRIDVEDATVA